MSRRNIAIIGAIVAVLLAAYFTKGLGLLGGSETGLTLYGNVDVRQVDLAFRGGGRIEAIGPEEGEQVKAGQAIARLDVAPMRDELAAARAQLGVANAELAKARAGSRPQEITQAEARSRQAQASLESAQEDYDRRAKLVETGAVSRQVFDATEAKLQSARAEARAAAAALSLAREGSRTEDRQAAAAQAEAARARRDSARTGLDDAVLRAPSGGTVLTRAREPGAIVGPGETVLTLTIDRPMRIRAYVGADDLSRISPGMKVQVTTDGNARRYAGKIAQIAPKAEFTPKTVQTEDLRADLVYRVRILIDDPDQGLRQGQPVTVNIPAARPAAD
ncbi:HlyD family efflux transporter periplasmic adaptor subunit [Croceicoccus naphthovorans]|uniref:HlyD family efflux transporter periplasmic adaptor subunit n=1 Tax=Croceicoccus naphthovorans TaxID=1348774 RepID=UPI00069E1BE4|nr:HlyD family efflux transporter periplasmic adaptor subunit [Croceicoccus naphthovorans]MBB3989762.1 HlyD family secretion protein [Croceicoccus naphthovorans]